MGLMDEQREQLLKLLEAVGRKLIAAEKTLTDLDAAIGDGDCGASLKKGWQVILDRLPSLQEPDHGWHPQPGGHGDSCPRSGAFPEQSMRRRSCGPAKRSAPKSI